ncbi:PIN domain-containing protein [Halorutilales archaeon Cl-col2-1]
MNNERIVFDTEPLVAQAASETGEEVVESYLDRVKEGDLEGFVSPVTLTEVKYITQRVETAIPTDVFLSWIQTLLHRVDASDCWNDAARYKEKHQVALGDAYSLATANYVDGTLLAGADDDFDTIDDVDVERFREDSV